MKDPKWFSSQSWSWQDPPLIYILAQTLIVLTFYSQLLHIEPVKNDDIQNSIPWLKHHSKIKWWIVGLSYSN